MKDKFKSKKGFTLTELIIVIVIIGILAAVLIPSLTKYIEKARNAAALQEAAPYVTALSTYNVEYHAGTFSGSFEDYCIEYGLNVSILIPLDSIVDYDDTNKVSFEINADSIMNFKTDGFMLWQKNNRLVVYNHKNGISDLYNLNKEQIVFGDSKNETEKEIVLKSLSSFNELKNAIESIKDPEKGIEFNVNSLSSNDKKITTTAVLSTKGILCEIIEGTQNCQVISSPNLTGEIVFPSFYIENDIKYTVVSIKENAFKKNESITSIVISDTIVKIGASAFSSCTNLEKLVLGKSVKEIANYAFSPCTNLAEIRVDPENPFFDSRNDCNAIIETKTNTILNGCKNTIITSDIEKIGDLVFLEVTFQTNFDIPSSVRVIGNNAFQYATFVNEINLINVEKIGDCAFQYATLGRITFSEQLVEIGSFAFSGTQIETVTLPNSIISIGKSAFQLCSKLETATFGENSQITVIMGNLFSDCPELETVLIPQSVKKVEKDAFKGTKLFNNVTNNVVYNGNWVIGYKGTITSVEIPNNIINIASNAFQSATGLNSITLNDNLRYIGSDAFNSCSSLQSIHIPSSVEEIGPQAFTNCSKLESIIVESGNFYYTSQDDEGKECNALMTKSSDIEGQKLMRGTINTIIPSTVKIINANAFSKVEITNILLPDSIVEIKDNAFENCKKLEQIYISSNTEIIRNNAFRFCDSLTIFLELTNEEVVAKYDSSWNIANRPVVLGCKFDEKGALISFNQIINVDSTKKISDPTCSGYTFLGWSLTQGDDSNLVASINIVNGNEEYFAIWQKNE